MKLRAFISEELRAWEKTFPDELWEEFGRLTGWKTPLQTRPKWWGKLVTELIYDTLDDEVATYLMVNLAAAVSQMAPAVDGKLWSSSPSHLDAMRS